MRGLKIATVSASLILAGSGIASANTFDGTNLNPEYMTGITNVYGVSDQQIEFYAPVYSFDACELEDGSNQDACVWHSPTRGNYKGVASFVKLGGGITATVSNEAARILLHGEPEAVPEAVAAPSAAESVPSVSEDVTEPPTAVREDVPVQAVERLDVSDNDSEVSNNVITEGWEDEGNKRVLSAAEITAMSYDDFEKLYDDCMDRPEYLEIDCSTLNFE